MHDGDNTCTWALAPIPTEVADFTITSGPFNVKASMATTLGGTTFLR